MRALFVSLLIFCMAGCSYINDSLYGLAYRSSDEHSKKIDYEGGQHANCSHEGSFELGQVWYVTEGIWHSVWTRQGDTNSFKAVTQNAQGNQFTYELQFQAVKNGQVRFYRKDTHGYYRGQLSCDQKNVFNGTGDWFVPGDSWSATVTP